MDSDHDKVEPVPLEQLQVAAEVLGLTASDAELTAIAELVAANRKRYAYPRRHPMADGGDPQPAARFDPLAGA